MIELKDLDKTFNDIHAADHITGTIQDGMVFGLIALTEPERVRFFA